MSSAAGGTRFVASAAGMERAADNRALRDSPPGQDSWSRASANAIAPIPLTLHYYPVAPLPLGSEGIEGIRYSTMSDTIGKWSLW